MDNSINNNANELEVENTNTVDPVGKNKRMRRIRKMCIFILLVCLMRMIVVSIFFNPIHFGVALVLSIVGIIAVKTKNRCCLIGFGLASVIQSFFGTFMVTYITLNYGMQFPMVFFFMLVSMLIGLSGVYAFRIRRKVAEYERYHGAYPTCCRSRRCQQYCQQPQQQQNVENQQQTIIQPSINSSFNDYVMIPMQSIEQPQQQQQQIPQQQQSPLLFNNQQIPIVYAINPQQSMIPQPQQQQIQPTHFIQQGQHFIPVQPFIQQQQIVQQPQQQQIQQQPFVPQIIQPQIQPTNTQYVYRI